MNQEEAKAIAHEVERRLKEWLKCPEDKSPTRGVTTLNAQQQSLILDLLDGVRRADNSLLAD